MHTESSKPLSDAGPSHISAGLKLFAILFDPHLANDFETINLVLTEKTEGNCH